MLISRKGVFLTLTGYAVVFPQSTISTTAQRATQIVLAVVFSSNKRM
jgi:hypothetical protein